MKSKATDKYGYGEQWQREAMRLYSKKELLGMLVSIGRKYNREVAGSLIADRVKVWVLADSTGSVLVRDKPDGRGMGGYFLRTFADGLTALDGRHGDVVWDYTRRGLEGAMRDWNGIVQTLPADSQARCKVRPARLTLALERRGEGGAR